MHASDFEGVEFVAYQLKDMAYQWYEEWDQFRGDEKSQKHGMISRVLFLIIYFLRS